MQQFTVPILLLAWRRPDSLQQVIDAIRPLQPVHLYVACDGASPTKKHDAELVKQTRLVVEQQINWPCQIKKLYSDTNQGCRVGVSSALNWFFSHVDEGIVLEDDCVPHRDFFQFCEVLLKRYRDDTRIWCISGSNFQDSNWRGNASYYFSRYTHCWGWATWRRCWLSYDSNLVGLSTLAKNRLDESVFPNLVERIYWILLWRRLAIKGLPDSWAYRWTFTCFVNSGLTILPNRNLVRNIGFDQYATHTAGKIINTNIDQGVDPNDHPSLVLPDSLADEYTFYHVFAGKIYRVAFFLSLLPKKIARPIISIFFNSFGLG